MSWRWRGRSSSATSKRRAPPTAWTTAPQKSNSRRARKRPSISRATRPCSTTCACGTGARFTTRSARASRCGPTPTPTPMSIATQIDGQMRQVLLAPRELDLTQLGDAQSRWVITHTIYTHGYGLVLAEANRITPAGLPELLIRNAPVEVLTPSLKLTRPEIYYGEQSHEPVFVRTAQPEFNYPSGSEEVHTRYEGQGGFPADSMGMRLASAWAFGDPNIVLSDAFTPESRMMIRRGIRERLEHAGSVHHLGSGSLHGDRRRRPPGVDRGRLHDQRSASLFAADSGRGRRRVQLHPQFGQGHRRRLRRRRQAVSVRRSGSADSGLPAPVSRAVHARGGDARGCAAPHALSGNAVPRAGRDLPHLSHARSGVVLQSRRSVGSGDLHQRPGRESASRDADLSGRDAAGRDQAGVPADRSRSRRATSRT